jgi:hypothetical protein
MAAEEGQGKASIDMGADPAWFAAAKAVPLLVPDPVVARLEAARQEKIAGEKANRRR